MPIEHREYAYSLKDVMKNDFRYAWDQKELWEIAKNKKVQSYDIKDVKHWIYNQCWSDKNNCFISPYQVLIQSKKYPNHLKRIKNANLKYPLIVQEDKYDKYGTILDGNHRFAKIILNKKRKVKFVYFTTKELNKLKIKM